MTNIELARRILQFLGSRGVETICLCPGGRNAPFVDLLDGADIEIKSFFDERSAGFFALGRAKRDQKPVAVITTSGTAVTELMSSVVEAYYSGIPLIIVTADRPKNFRGTGAPQIIEQANVFSGYVEKSYDFDGGASDFTIDWNQVAPLHLNTCFKEPLLDERKHDYKYNCSTVTPAEARASHSARNKMDFSSEFNIKRPLIIVGELTGPEADSAAELLANYRCPVFYEAHSGLREYGTLQDFRIKSENLLIRALRQQYFDGIIRIGGVPTSKIWRDAHNFKIPVISISHRPFSGSPQAKIFVETLRGEFHLLPNGFSWDCDQLILEDRQAWQQLLELVEEFPFAEPSWFWHLSQQIHSGDQLYLGNSLPIRQWDLIAEPKGVFRAHCNRGANGIDGQLSSALGGAHSDRLMWCVLGDLTTLYDLNALTLKSQLPGAKINLVVINNQGGQIFSRLFASELFINPQQFALEDLARGFGWSHLLWDSPLKAVTKINDFTMIEIVPDKNQTNQFWDRFDKLWK